MANIVPKSGLVLPSGNFQLTVPVTSLDRLMELINTKRSIFIRHKMWPTSWVLSQHLREVDKLIKQGLIWESVKLIK